MTARHTRDGIVLGAAVGLGFAAFETAGYSFNAMFTERGLSVTALVETELLRSVLAPVGHGLWTAILGGVLFWGLRQGRWLTGRLVLTYLWVAFLHALWDGSHDLAILVTFLLTGSYRQYELLRVGYLPSPTPGQVVLFAVLSLGALVVVAALGLATLRGVWRGSADEQRSMTDPNRPAAVNWLAGAGGQPTATRRR
jgi:hypothetical protein